MAVKNMTDTSCDRYGRVYNAYLGDRYWSGTFTELAPDGTLAEYSTLCDSCHRQVVRS